VAERVRDSTGCDERGATPRPEAEGPALTGRDLRPRVAFVTDKSAPWFVGGYENRVWQLACQLTPSYDATILSSSPSPGRQYKGPEFRQIFPGGFETRPAGGRTAFGIAVLAASSLCLPRVLFDFDVVVIQAIPYVHVPGVIRAARRGGCALILDVSEAWADFRGTSGALASVRLQAVRWLLREAIAKVDRIVAVSTATARSLETRYGIDRQRIVIVPNGVDPGAWNDPAPSIIERDIDMITVGRLVPPKRVSDLLRALGLLKHNSSWSGLATIVGDGPDLPSLRQLAAKLGLANNVRFVGRVSDHERTRLLRKSKLFVLTSEREGFSIASLEAMSQGLPLVASRPPTQDVFGVSDIVREGVSGELFPTGDYRKLSEILGKLLSDPTRVAVMGRSAREMSRDYSWDLASKKLETVLAASLESRARRQSSS